MAWWKFDTSENGRTTESISGEQEHSHIRTQVDRELCRGQSCFRNQELGPGRCKTEIDGKDMRRGKDFRCWYRYTLKRTGLIVWIKEAIDPAGVHQACEESWVTQM